MTLPIADTFATTVAAATLPRSGPVRRLGIQARSGNVLHFRVGLARLSLLPDIPMEFRIEQQPVLPAR